MVSASFAQSYETLRNPYIPTASVTPPDMAADPGQPPPMGSGDLWIPTPGGDWGAPFAPPSHVYISPTSPLEKDLVNAEFAPYWQPAAQNDPVDYGPIPGTTSGWIPPAALVNINPEGGMPGDFAPRERWNGQTTRDLGYPKMYGSRLTDFGLDIDKMPSVVSRGVVRNQSQDGPRPFIFPAPIGAKENREPNLNNAQITQDLHGNRQLFKGPVLRARMTQANY